MAQVDVVGGIAVGSDLSPDDAKFSGGTPAAWALRWFLISVVLLLFVAFASRKG